MPTDAHRIRGFLLFVVVMAGLIGANYLAFRRFGDTNYFEWYLENGSVISLGLSMVAVVYEGLRMQRDLLSAHPGRYLIGCLGVAGLFFWALSAHYKSGSAKGADRSLIDDLSDLFDDFIAIGLAVPIFGLVLAWLLVVAPMNYLVTVFSGAMSRQALRGLPSRCVVTETEKVVTFALVPTSQPVAKPAVDASLARDPFVLTQVLTALVLWLIERGRQLWG